MKKIIIALFASQLAYANLCQEPSPADFLLSPILPQTPDISFDIELNSGWTGAGGGTSPDADNSWFATDSAQKPVEYCIVRSAHFPFSDADAKRIIEESISDWKKFFSKYGILNKNFAYTDRRMNLGFSDSAPRWMNMNFKQVNCAPGENPKDSGRLIFLFGMSNPLLQTYQRFSREVELGFTLRGPYDHGNYNNGGYVWIGGFTSDERRMKHLVLHELGHVFGMKHNSVFVMDANIAIEILRPQIKSSYFGRIESAAWKYRISGEPITLTADEGKFVPMGDEDQNPCQSDDAVLGENLPAYVTQAFRLSKNSCYSIKLRTQKIPPKRRGHGRVAAELYLTNVSTGRTHHFGGFFEAGRVAKVKSLGPGIYTKFKNTGRSSRIRPHVVRRVSLDSEREIFPARGFFSYGRQQFPARISKDKGTVVEVFIPQLGRWWTIRNVHSGRQDSVR